MSYNKIFITVVMTVVASGVIATANEVITNGGFETNGGAGSNVFAGWTVDDQAGGSGTWYVQTGTNAPVNAFTVPAPPEGNFAAMTDAMGPGSHALLQTFLVPGPGTATLTFQYLRNNLGPDYLTPNTLDYNSFPNQQARVDILTGTALPFATDASDLMTVFQTNSGDPTMDTAYQTFSDTITFSTAGAYQLRFAEVDNMAQFEFGVDTVSMDFTPAVPEPNYVAFLIVGGIALALADAVRRKTR